MEARSSPVTITEKTTVFFILIYTLTDLTCAFCAERKRDANIKPSDLISLVQNYILLVLSAKLSIFGAQNYSK
jgi:hypothetical protein